MGRPKVHSVMKVWQRTGSKGSLTPSGSRLWSPVATQTSPWCSTRTCMLPGMCPAGCRLKRTPFTVTDRPGARVEMLAYRSRRVRSRGSVTGLQR